MISIIDIYALTLFFSINFALMVLVLIHRGKLREEYSLLWLAVGVFTIFLALNKDVIEILASWLGVLYAPSLLFLFALIFCFLLLLQLTVVVSDLTSKIIRLTQNYAIFEEHLRNTKEGEEK